MMEYFMMEILPGAVLLLGCFFFWCRCETKIYGFEKAKQEFTSALLCALDAPSWEECRALLKARIVPDATSCKPKVD
jgi:hypothetical protein